MNKQKIRRKMMERYEGLQFIDGNNSTLTKHNCFLIKYKGHKAFVEADKEGKIIYRYPYKTHLFTMRTGKHVRLSGYLDVLKDRTKEEREASKAKDAERRKYISDTSFVDNNGLKRATTNQVAGASTWINDNKEYINNLYSNVLSKYGKMDFLCIKKNKLPKQPEVIVAIGGIFIEQYNFKKYRYTNGNLYLHM